MTITATEMRNKVNEFNEAKAKAELKTAEDYVTRIVEPHIERCANKGLTETTVEVPLTVDIDLVKNIIKAQGFAVNSVVYTITIKW